MTDKPLHLCLVQYLCPNRHATVAVPYDLHEFTPDQVEATVLDFVVQHLDGVCYLCGSREFHFEHGTLPFTDWDAALNALRIVESDNLATRRLVQRLRSSTN